VNRTSTPGLAVASPATAPPARRVAGRPALYLLASLIVSLLAASSAPTPLYATYAREWGFTPVTTTVIFGAYAVTVLAALLTRTSGGGPVLQGGEEAGTALEFNTSIICRTITIVCSHVPVPS
jgi:hypothetical protein